MISITIQVSIPVAFGPQSERISDKGRPGSIHHILNSRFIGRMHPYKKPQEYETLLCIQTCKTRMDSNHLQAGGPIARERTTRDSKNNVDKVKYCVSTELALEYTNRYVLFRVISFVPEEARQLTCYTGNQEKKWGHRVTFHMLTITKLHLLHVIWCHAIT